MNKLHLPLLQCFQVVTTSKHPIIVLNLLLPTTGAELCGKKSNGIDSQRSGRKQNFQLVIDDEHEQNLRFEKKRLKWGTPKDVKGTNSIEIKN